MAMCSLRHLMPPCGTQVWSRGVAVDPKELAMNPSAVEALRSRGIEVDLEHRATPLAQSDVENADVIVVMTQLHRQKLLDLHPTAAKKARLLLSYADSKEDLSDPLGHPLDVYQACLDSIQSAVQQLARTAAENGACFL